MDLGGTGWNWEELGGTGRKVGESGRNWVEMSGTGRNLGGTKLLDNTNLRHVGVPE